MKAIEVCPSKLRSGFTTYSPKAVKDLFDGVAVSPSYGLRLLTLWVTHAITIPKACYCQTE